MAHNRQTIFLFRFFFQEDDIFRHFICLFQTPDLKVIRDRTKRRRILAIFSSFSSSQPGPVLGSADLRYHLSRLNQNAQHISCRVCAVRSNVRSFRLRGIRGIPAFFYQTTKAHISCDTAAEEIMCVFDDI